LQFFFFFAVIAVRLCRDICGKRRNFLLNKLLLLLQVLRVTKFSSNSCKCIFLLSTGRQHFLSWNQISSFLQDVTLWEPQTSQSVF